MHRNIHTSLRTAIAIALALTLGSQSGSVLRSTPLELQSVEPHSRSKVMLEEGFAPVVQKAAPSVVNISSSKIVKSRQTPGVPGEILQFLFGPDANQQGVVREHRERSLGSGVIVHPNGYILTNNHIVEDATQVTVSLTDKRELVGKVVGSDPGTDIAVLKIEADGLTAIPFADSSEVEVGDLALAIGNPFGLGRTVTMGIVSATGRGGYGIEDYEDFIQTDASINPGGSGGALTNTRGELIGINTAILSPTGGNLGIAFAIPSNMARNVMDQIVRTGKVTRGFMGVLLQDVTPEIAEAMKLGQTRGALISDVESGSPAARAGLEPADVVVEAGGKPVADRRELQLFIASMHPGTAVSMRVQRDGSMRNVSLTLSVAPKQKAAGSDQGASGPSLNTPAGIGIQMDDLTPEIRQEFKIPATIKGVVIGDVEEGSAADEAGLQPGDVIHEVNRHPVENKAQLQSEIARLGPDVLLLRVSREGHGLFVAIK